MKFPNGSQWHHTFIAYALPNSCLLFTYTGESKGEALYLVIETSILRSLQRFNYFFVMGQKEKEKVELGRQKQSN
jgi:hypothetical protein